MSETTSQSEFEAISIRINPQNLLNKENTMSKRKNEGAAVRSKSSRNKTLGEDENMVTHSQQEEDLAIGQNHAEGIDDDIDDFEKEVPWAIEQIYSESYYDDRGDVAMIYPRLKLTFSICPSTPTQEMQMDAINKLNEYFADPNEDPCDALRRSFALKQVFLGKDIVSFIGDIKYNHEPLMDIRMRLREKWEEVSQKSGLQSRSECKEMAIILE